MFGLPPENVSMVRQLHGRGLAVDDIAGLMRMTDELVRKIIDKLGPQTAEEAKAEGEAWEAAEAARAERHQARAVNTTARGKAR